MLCKSNILRNTQQRQTALLEICTKELLSLKMSEMRIISTHRDDDTTSTISVAATDQHMQLYCRNKSKSMLARNHRTASFTGLRCQINGCPCSCHYSDTISGKDWSIKYPRNPWFKSCNRKSCTNFKITSFWVCLSRFGIKYAVTASLKVMWGTHNMSISPFLQVKRVVDWYSLAFLLLGRIRWSWVSWIDGRSQLADLFDAGRASPFDILPDGKSMVEVCPPTITS
jgi:hypothetical protein